MDRKVIGFVDFNKALAAGILLVAFIVPSLTHADCSKLIDKNLEYYNGIKDHLVNMTTYDPGIKKLPYDVKIIDNNSQRYPLLSRNISFFYPNASTRSLDLIFYGGSGDENGYIQAICIIQTPDRSKWVVWKDDFRLYFYDEDE